MSFIISNHAQTKFISISCDFSRSETSIHWYGNKSLATVYNTVEEALKAEEALNDFIGDELAEIVDYQTLIPYYDVEDFKHYVQIWGIEQALIDYKRHQLFPENNNPKIN